MINIRTTLNLIRHSWIIPGALALFGTLIIYQGLSSYKDHLGFNMVKTKIMVATRGLPEGRILQASDIESFDIPKKLTPIGVLLYTASQKALGRTLMRPVAKGEMLVWSAIDITFEGTSSANKIAPGYRAISVPVSSSTSVGQSIRAGDHVDITATMKIDESLGAQTTFTLLQNVSVLEVGSPHQDKNSFHYSTITLMVLPKEVALITAAQQRGILSFILRNPQDHETPQNLPPISQKDLVQQAFRNSLQKERNHQIEIIRARPSPEAF